MRYFDAHNHLQDERFAGRQELLLREAKDAGVVKMVVNGSCEEDWSDVAALAFQYREVIPSFGLHPWYHHQRSPEWLDRMTRHLQQQPSAIGEIGLDRWKEGLPYEDQEKVFLDQWLLACKLNRPASIHCLKSWGRLLELMRENPGPARGFLLHSYGGPVEMVDSFAALGAYFSFPGYYAHPRKEKQRETFRRVPLDRLLIETDAPDQSLPDDINQHPLRDPAGKPINHPANLAAVYQVVADLRDMPLADLAKHVEQNSTQLFGINAQS